MKPLHLSLLLCLALLVPCCTCLAFSVKGRKSPSTRRTNKPKHKNTDFVRRRQSGQTPKGSRKRTPRWEQEGDLLYQEIPIEKKDALSYENTVKKLQELEQLKPIIKPVPKRTPPPATTPTKKPAPPHTVWGTLPVGPILKNQLEAGRITEPTPIQEACFTPLSQGQNAVLASPTGSGKTLAFLVPLLATKPRTVDGQILIVTPTVELAYQIQSQVDQLLWVPNAEGGSAVHVVGSGEEMVDCPIVIGTPRKIRDLLAEDLSLLTNLKTIVLDEADRLLRTEGTARPKDPRHRSSPTQTQLLLRELGDINRYQLICASATVGRTLRRQLQEITNSPSIDKASQVITADTRSTAKHVDKRRAALLPDTIAHYCVLVKEDRTVLETLSDVLTDGKPCTTMIFSGKQGVQSVQTHLEETMGLKTILSMDDINNNDDKKKSKRSSTWKDTPVYVVPDKFARGLDIAGGIDQVILLGPPSSAAGYMHLAGRTGRNGQSGRAITLVQPTHVMRLVTIAERLGIQFGLLELETTEAEQEQDTPSTAADNSLLEKETEQEEDPSSATDNSNPWAELTNAQLTRKTVAELKEYMEGHGIAMPTMEKRVLKSDLIAAITGSA